MSRLTGTDAYSLMEAYQAVYAPQELTEEQVWEEVETWVNSLIEEGHDLSDYTWEEMYEAYLEELLGMPGAQNAGASLRQNFGRARRAVGGAISDVAGSAARGVVGKTTTSKNPISQAYNAVARGVTAVPRAAASFAGGVLSGRPGATNPPAKPTPSAEPYKSRFAGARDAAFAKAQNIKGSPVVGSKPTASPPAATSAAGAPASAKVAPTKPTAPAKPATGMLGKTSFERRTPTSSELKAAQSARASGASPEKALQAAKSAGGALSQATAAASKPAAFSPTPAVAKTSPTPAAKPTPRQQRLNMEMEYDTFDSILEHLIDEGYADTEESALAIMTNMSEEWRQQILGEGPNYDKNRRRAAQRAAERNAARDRGQTGNVPGVGYVTSRREGETYRDSAGVERHTSGARMPKKEG